MPEGQSEKRGRLELMFFTIGGSVIAGRSRRIRSERETEDSLVLGSIIGSGVGFYRGIRETAELTGSVRTSS
jgi:hypothetical protein